MQAQRDAEEARAADRVAISPESIVLRMKFTYGLENERSPKPMERSETVGILIPGGSTQAAVDAMARAAMERAGPAAFAESIDAVGGRWCSTGARPAP